MAAFDGGAQGPAMTSGQAVHYLGAVAALGILAGIGVWSYDLIKRDVSGIPVVRAVEGDMRVLPENPGGEVALHTGLAVNSVAAEGEAAELSDTVVLAPSTPELAEEDLIISPRAEAEEVAPIEIAPEERPTQVLADATEPTGTIAAETGVAEPVVREVLTAEDVQRLADELAAGVAPLEAIEDGQDVPPVLSVDGDPAVQIIPASVPGVTRSLRPTVRPARSEIEQVVQAVAAAAPTTPAPAVQRVVAPGTNLVQLGAFPSEADASAAWTALQAQFGDYLVNKERVIQAADSGGTTFYRLRALGFDDLSDARRLCAALEAGNADCIPVVVR